MKKMCTGLLIAFASGVFAQQSAVVGVNVLEEKTDNESAVGQSHSASSNQMTGAGDMNGVMPVVRVNKGTFRENVDRIADELGFGLVVWDKRVKDCVWSQDTEYPLPAVDDDHAPIDVFTFYLQTQDFTPIHSNVDNSVVLVYSGPSDRLSYCE